MLQELAPEVQLTWTEIQDFVGTVKIKGGQVEGNPLEQLVPMVTAPLGDLFLTRTCRFVACTKDPMQR